LAAQLDQLLAYLDRPGTIELTFCVGKPITMRNAKGVLNVTGRALGSDQLASIVRGTPLEAIIADESVGEPVTVELGKREVTIEIQRGDDHPTVRIRTASEKRQRPKGRAKPPSNRPVTREEKEEKPARATTASEPATEVIEVTLPKQSRTRTAPRGAPIFDRPPSRPSSPTPVMGQPTTPVTNQTLLGRPSPLAPAPSTMPPQFESTQFDAAPSEIELPEPPGGPPGLSLELDEPGSQFDIELPAPPPAARPKTPTSSGPLRIDIRKMTEPPPMAAGEPFVGFVTSERPPAMPLVHEGRTFETLGLPADIAHIVARDHGLVLITAPHGHGKTSTLGALFDRVDRKIAPHVVTIDTLRDRESIDLALTTAESGYFVLATLTAPSPAAAIEALLDSYPGMAHGRVKTRLASALVAMIAKRLPPTPSEIITGDALRKLL